MSASIPAPKTTVFADKNCILRTLNAGDLERLRAFFYSHTPETIHARYGYMIKDMTPQRATQLVCIDQTRDLALGIFEPAAGEILHAVGRYCLDTSGTSAEAAFVVRETLRNSGMAGCLLDALVNTARTRGLVYLWASTAPDNHAMLHLLHKAGFRQDRHLTDGTMMMKLALKRKPAASPRTRSGRKKSSTAR